MSEDFFELSIFYLLQDDYICMYILAPKKIEESFITIYFGRTSLFYIWGLLCVYIYKCVCAFVWLYECIYGMYNYVYMYVCVCQYTLYLCRWTYVTCIARITYMTYTKCKTHMLDEVQRNIAFHFITLDYIILLVLSRGE
jgi:hypothetical protein